MNQYVPCPKCNTPEPQRMKFTWWGGLLGPKILNHVKCAACGNTFNGKSGKPNTNGIIIYMVAVLIIFGLFFTFLFAAIFALPYFLKTS